MSARFTGRGVVHLVDDSKKMQTLQIGLLSGETRTAERFQNYGFNSVPMAGAEHVTHFINGANNHPVVLGVDDRRYRPRNWAAGDTGMYHYLGDSVRLSASGIAFTTAQITASGKITAQGVIETASSYKVAGIKVIGAQRPAIADATNAATAITQLNFLLAAMRAHGAIAT